ncbi:MAG: 50S ribosomal protein L29 [Candidatus Riesia sp.]|nr:50S ribosomal protein L29 [Candidatus Riesia sp.]
MKIKDFKNKNSDEIKIELISLYRKKLQLNLEKSNSSNFKSTHILRNVKKNLARLLTFINDKKRELK